LRPHQLRSRFAYTARATKRYPYRTTADRQGSRRRAAAADLASMVLSIKEKK